ncbi:MAG: ATP-binding protein [Candidatus Sabulitectum sp.]|nr:ATP-binding protein [Candidatus Sabulitectum sp.]
MANIRVRARAVEMLGRQQIAGIPTALHELLKNAHDAYADQVEVDFFRQDKSLLIRDDGVGMTLNEFETRWLTLGTESKLEGNAIKPPYTDPHKPLRPVLGEKGIGRLAIAAIGRPMLILTRAERNGKLKNLVACFIHWGLFEIPGLDLSEIEIPVLEWTHPGLPDQSFITNLIGRIESNVRTLANRIPSNKRREILNDLDEFKIAPDKLYPLLGGLTLDLNRGTHFFIRPVDSILELDIDDSSDSYASPLKKNLIGFCNSMTPSAPLPAITISFRDHRRDGRIIDLIDPEHEFFTPADYKAADHHFEGSFDEFGQFTGTIKVYGADPIKYVLAWSEAKGRPTKCGPFSFKMAYVQGNQSESKLPPELYGPLVQKLNQIGGLYVYRDNIRILPYGNSDYDWVNIEKRRTLAAKDYIFSYRRLFGIVEITKQNNNQLIEKAGREGFMENKAYKEMRALIQYFLIEVVREHFRKGSDQAANYWQVKNEFKKQHKLLQARNKRVGVRKKQFAADLGNFFQKLETNKPEQDITKLNSFVEDRISAISLLSDENEAGRQILLFESEFKCKFSDLKNEYRIVRPRGIGLTKNQLSNWNAYCREFHILEEKYFSPLLNSTRSEITSQFNTISNIVFKRKRIDQALEGIKDTTDKKAKQLQKKTQSEVLGLNERILSEIREHIANLQTSIQTTLSDFEKLDIAEFTDVELLVIQSNYEDKLEKVSLEEISSIENVRSQINMLSEALLNDESITDVTVALEERAENFKEQLDLYAEMAQIGTAVGILQHEFSSTFTLMENNIKQLRGWASTNPRLGELYKHIRNNFQHLDEYMTMFKPFNRRMHRRKINIPGQEIRFFLKRLFEDRLKRHNVTIIGTKAFDNTSIYAYPSTIYPCFVNLVDNSIYWLTKDTDGIPRVTKKPKNIYLDADEMGVTVRDNGPGIKSMIADRIFDFGYTRKKNGRGMGLYISREILRRENLDLILDNPKQGRHSTFRIVTTDISNEVNNAD